MKLNKIFAAFMLIAAAAIVGCNPVPNAPDQDKPGQKPGQDSTTTTEGTEWKNLPEGALTVAEARDIASKLASTEVSAEKYYVYGVVKKLHSKHTQETIEQYGNGSFYMVDKTGDSNDFLAYQVYSLNGQKFKSVDEVAVGDSVILYCHITNYNGTFETTGKGDGYIYWSNNPKAGNVEGEEPNPNPNPNPEGLVGEGTEAKPYTVADVLTLNNTKSGNYFAKGIIVGQIKGTSMKLDASSVEFAAPFTPNADGNGLNLLIADAAGTTDIANLVVVQLPGGIFRETLSLVAHPENVGKEVVIYGSLEKYFGGVGIKSMSRAFLDGEEVVLEIGEAPEATPATVAEFIAAPVNTTTEGVWYELTGTIGGTINDTYGNFDLTDATGTVYVYGLTASYRPLLSATKADNDKSYNTLGLKAGDNITIRGVRADFNGKNEMLGAYLVKKN